MTISRNVPLSAFTTFRIGGNAEFFTEVESDEELRSALGFCGNVTILGGGSNLLVSDRGVKGLVVRMCGQKISYEGGLIVAESGVKLSKLARAFRSASFGGMEWAAMIPGTVGGACKMNAGAHDSCIEKTVEWVEVLRQGCILRLPVADCGFVYRGSGLLPDDVVIRAAFVAKRVSKAQIIERSDELIRQRKASQPGGKSAGSVFKRVKETGIAAGWYIDCAGFKGMRKGDAVVSKLHANFILNTGAATAADVSELIAQIRAGVRQQFGLELEEEIERVGEF